MPPSPSRRRGFHIALAARICPPRCAPRQQVTMPSRVQLRHRAEDSNMDNRLRASCISRKFASLYVEVVDEMLARVVDDGRARTSLLEATVALLPEHAVAFSRATQGVGKIAEREQVEAASEFCREASAFRSRFVKSDAHLVVTSIDHGQPGAEDTREWVACNAVAGCAPLRSASSVTAVCCVCGFASPLSTTFHELCACGASIFCTCFCQNLSTSLRFHFLVAHAR